MAEGSIITNELRKLIGLTTGPFVFKVEEGAIQRYAKAIGDPNPLFNDVGYAKKSKYGRLTCPPGFNGWPANEGPDVLTLPTALIMAGAPPRALDGGVEYDFLEPIGAGDTLTLTTKIIDMTEKETKSGDKMLITTVDITLVNQDGNVAVKSRVTVINR